MSYSVEVLPHNCKICDGSYSPSIFEQIGHNLIERTEGYDVLDEYELPVEELCEQIGQQALHSGGPSPTPGQEAFARLDERLAEEEILPRIDDEIIEEHKQEPVGQHSDDLQRVLHYFRRAPTEGKYIVVETERSSEWAIGVLSGKRGVGPEILSDRFDSPKKAMHEIFLRRIDEFQEEYGE